MRGRGLGSKRSSVTMDSCQSLQVVRELRLILEDLADRLDKLDFKATAVNVAGATVAVVGTALSVAGGVLAAFTLGTSLVLVVLGGSLAASGGFAVTASQLAHSVGSKRLLRMAERKWTSLKQHHLHPHLHVHLHLLGRETTRPGDEKALVVRKSEKSTPLSLVDGVVLSLSIKDLVMEGVERHRKSGEPAGAAVRELAEALEVFENKSARPQHSGVVGWGKEF